jgi:hypothetical protein
MSNWAWLALAGSVVGIPAIRAIVKAIRLRKSTADIVADALEAAVDGVEKKTKK